MSIVMHGFLFSLLIVHFKDPRKPRVFFAESWIFLQNFGSITCTWTWAYGLVVRRVIRIDETGVRFSLGPQQKNTALRFFCLRVLKIF